MASPDLPKLVLSLEGDKIPADQFVDAAKSFFGLLDQVAAAMSGKRSSVEWSVSVEGGSVVMMAEPLDYQPAAPVRQIIARVSAGLRELERKADRPEHFNDDALSYARSLAQVAKNHRVSKASVRVRRGSRDTKPIPLLKTLGHVDDILGPTIRDYGTIEGTLETISVHGGNRCTLYDLMTERAIKCVFGDEKLDRAWRLLRNGSRVAVTGFIHYRKTGHPTRIEVDRLESIGGAGNIPAAEVYGILTR